MAVKDSEGLVGCSNLWIEIRWKRCCDENRLQRYELLGDSNNSVSWLTFDLRVFF